MDDLPYRAEYSKSARATCRGCKTPIAKDVLRMAVLVQSAMFDGKMTQWYHFPCFFTKQRPKSVGDIAHFEALRWEDQEKIKSRIEACGSAPAAGGASAKKGKKRASAASGGAYKDFTIEYAKSSRAMCRGCEEKIIKDEIRISKKDYESEVGRKYGGQDLWHHVDCFVKLRGELQFWASGAELNGFKTLSKDDQKEVKEKIPQVDAKTVKDEVDGPGPSKRVKTEKLDAGEEKALKKQSKLVYRIRDELKNSLSKRDLTEMLEYNEMRVPSGHERLLDVVSDILAFGVPLPCTECNGTFTFRSGVGYQCTGNLTEWVKCENKVLEPKRKPPKIPADLTGAYDFLADYKYKERKRIIRITPPTAIPPSVTRMLSGKSEPMEVDGPSKPKVERPPPPFKNMEFVILGKTVKDKDELKKDIQKLGGKVGTKIHEKVFAVISTQDEVDKKTKRMETVEELQIDVVPEDFVEEVAQGGTPLSLIKSKAISSWGSAPEKRVHEEKSMSKSRSVSMYTKSMPDKVKLKVKGGVAVDPDSKLEDVAHVYKKGSFVYNCVLCATDIQRDKNSYYKLQVLQSDTGNKFWLFRGWGRIGTTIGNTKLESLDMPTAISEFERLYAEKSGNLWEDHKNFVKRPNKMYPMDVTYGEEDTDTKKSLMVSNVESKLAKPVQSLINLLFDVDSMKKCMLEFELDLQKMPLGKISSSQILKAMGVLKELQNYLKSDDKDAVCGPNMYARLYDGSNRFYTLIPHDFGVDTPPVLDTLEKIQTKIEMLQSLLEIEIAYKLLDAGGDSEAVHPLDAHYNKLKADIEALERTSEEFQLIEKYLKNSHAETHTQYDLVIEDVFKVKRQGEDRRYKPFKKLHNRQLLWHGSRLTNFVGIISQGLRIAPPEAPACGYMFGKGIYFADRVSKSANYCMTSKRNPTGLMVLCEVALGNMYERHQADYIERLPKNKHSCKGVGRTQPDGGIDLEDGTHVPLGPAKTDEDPQKSLLYNEYIVYDVGQVQMKYLLKVNFKYK